MCGICGIYRFEGPPVSKQEIKAMNATLVHRGPDGEGVWCAGNIGLGHRRLSIIDLAGGAQPMSSGDGQVTVVFNGEIYNFLELKAELSTRGHVFRTRSDTECIINGYLEWGVDVVEHLRGMFAFAIWDSRQKRLVLARDRLGKKPLYYFRTPRTVAFASELKALLTLPWVPRDLDCRALDAYLSFGYVPSPLSIFQQISKLPPAHLALLEGDRWQIRQYWRLALDEEAPPEEDLLEQLAELFDQTVKLRMISDVPLGAFLSGGVDSSAVVASMACQESAPVTTTAIGFSEKEFDELEFARLVAKRYGTDHHEFVVRPEAATILPLLARHFDEPFADASAIPTYYVAKMAREKVTVALSGDGGDEVFAGYIQRYFMTRLEDRVRSHLPGWLRHHVLRCLAAAYPRLDNWPRPFRLKSFLTNVALDLEDAYFKDMSFYFSQEQKARLYQADFCRTVGPEGPGDFVRRHFHETKGLDVVTRVQYVDMMTYLPEDILVKVDRMTMANSLEVRSPLLDHKLIEFVARFASSLKLKGNISKYMFKKINEARLPPAVLYRKKQGFCVPLAKWLRADLREQARDLLFARSARIREYFSPSALTELWENHQQARMDNSVQLWGLVQLELWAREYLHRGGRAVGN